MFAIVVNMTKYSPLYGEDDYAKMCKDCCSNIMKQILKEHHIKKLKLNNPTDFKKFMEVVIEFIGIVESPEVQKEYAHEVGKLENERIEYIKGQVGEDYVISTTEFEDGATLIEMRRKPDK